jgi:putative N-acetyltransferase (TIGR04045 family)
MNAPLIQKPASQQLPRDYSIHAANDKEREAALKLRQAVFCNEQHIFEGSDLDATDENAIFLVARPLIIGTEGETNGTLLGPVVGTVRIHRLESQDGKREWQGSRLAVDAAFRRVGVIGAALIKLAVRTANTEGCDRFIATVQERNVTFFRRLHWNTVREIELHGRLHHLMEADLPHYPAFDAGEARRISVNRGA